MYNKTFLSASILLALSASVQTEKYGLFDEIVVSATRTNQTIDSVAASVAVVTEEQLEENMAKMSVMSSSMSQALQLTHLSVRVYKI